MEFDESLKQLIKKFESIKDQIKTEEATKMSLIVPFFQLLGYDVFNPQEFCPEYTADVGIKKGEKVDYAILLNSQPVILIEAKSVNKKLDKHSSQLFRYFVTTSARFAILTNGIVYQFYTDLEETNKMDKDPFLEFNLLDLKGNQITQIEKFHRKQLDVDAILNAASILKYNMLFKKDIAQQFTDPSNDFVRLFLQSFYKGAKTQAVIDKFKPILKSALTEYINETVNDKIKFALNNVSSTSSQENNISSNDEWEFVSIIKDILKDTTSTNNIFHKQTESYLAILLNNNTRKWICRLYLSSTQKTLVLPDENKKEQKYPINDINDIRIYAENIIEVTKRYMNTNAPIAEPKELLRTKWGVYEMPDPYKMSLLRGPRTDLKRLY